MNKPLSPIQVFLYLIFCLIIGFTLYRIWDSDYVYTYRKHISSNDVIHLDFNKLTAISIEDTKRIYKLNWWCNNNYGTMEHAGEMYCADELKGWDEIPAMTVVFWFKQNKLYMAKIDTPLWHHDILIKKIKKEYGEPIEISRRLNYINAIKRIGLMVATKGKYDSRDEMYEENRGIWELKTGGWLQTELKQDENIFSHNTVLWYSPEAVVNIKQQSIEPHPK